ncbi:putative alpha/beta hydrolase [Psychromicrobium silvestre]|uniref:Putative alpha/beta hydrolase n=1 Tax=Psychromicrobium silvestre TaxID=1645614 RepID=A0A7Y9LUD7_9MICC|nr:alpha/beta fold hydrolase [Psychromicrobium silvestre]NYE95772.1 putative alpha/beta hydrolase [Psychromicrobium silvestre]
MPSQLTLVTEDGLSIAATVFEASPQTASETVVISCATGVLARYYRRYAEFLAAQGFRTVTFDYRGIGGSSVGALGSLRGRWSDWGRYDLDAVLGYALQSGPSSGRVSLIGHSFGGFAAGLAPQGRSLSRILAIGAQHAFWLDYRRQQKLAFWYRWHLQMPALTLRLGYYPGKKLGLTEDLPRGVALDWARSPRNFTRGQPELRENLAAVTAPLTALASSDDPYATRRATQRMLRYYSSAPSSVAFLNPERYGERSLGHFALFQSRFENSFWAETVDYLHDGDPWR